MRWFFACLVVMVAGAWASSGTLAPYAATTSDPVIEHGCGYLLNTDHEHFAAAYRMLRGAPRDTWELSQMLRRILYPVLSFPFVKWSGMMLGGFIANILLMVAAMAWFAWRLTKHYDQGTALRATALVATYPGFAYWVGLPYSHALIVPASLVGFTLLLEADKRQWQNGAIIGVLSQGYDLIALFALAHRRWRVLVAFAITTAICTLLLSRLITWNDNTRIYPAIIGAYLSPGPGWGALLLEAPLIFVENFFSSGFFVLPVAFLLSLGQPLSQAEKGLLLAVLALFLFLNLAPPYESYWQMRGYWIPRLYQGAFVALVVYIARARRAWVIAPAIVLQAALVFGVSVTATGYAYHAFYKHGPASAYADNLAKHGRRPLGFCVEQ